MIDFVKHIKTACNLTYKAVLFLWKFYFKGFNRAKHPKLFHRGCNLLRNVQSCGYGR
jgi:hypothetical protein